MWYQGYTEPDHTEVTYVNWKSMVHILVYGTSNIVPMFSEISMSVCHKAETMLEHHNPWLMIVFLVPVDDPMEQPTCLNCGLE